MMYEWFRQKEYKPIKTVNIVDVMIPVTGLCVYFLQGRVI
jgi:hypothetical protein